MGAAPVEVLIAELGVDMRAFPTARHVASWAGLCPGTHESAGKRRAVRTTKGNHWLRTALIEAALAAVNVRDSALASRYRRLRPRCGHKKAIVAVAQLLTTAYLLLADGRAYQEFGAGYDEARRKDRDVRRALHALERHGYRVSLEPAAEEAPYLRGYFRANPPDVRSAPAKPCRSSGMRGALGAPKWPPISPTLRATAEPWRSASVQSD